LFDTKCIGLETDPGFHELGAGREVQYLLAEKSVPLIVWGEDIFKSGTGLFCLL